jgi:hypothetical protein
MSQDVADKALARFRPWLYAAALYNLLWGALTILFPDALFRLLHLPLPSYPPLWQVVGMFVLVYAPGYAWAARRPSRHGHLILLGMLGKVLGPMGFLWAAITGQLPWRFGLVILTNDLLWWPAFTGYLQAAARAHGGWKAFLRGD